MEHTYIKKIFTVYQKFKCNWASSILSVLQGSLLWNPVPCDWAKCPSDLLPWHPVLTPSQYFLLICRSCTTSISATPLRTEIAFLSGTCFQHLDIQCLVLNTCLLNVFKWMDLTPLILTLCHCRLLLVVLLRYNTPNFGVFSRNCFLLFKFKVLGLEFCETV